MNDELARAMVELNKEDLLCSVKARADAGEDPLGVLEECRLGMALVGERFQAGDYYLAEMMLAAEMFKSVVSILDPLMQGGRDACPRARIVLATSARTFLPPCCGHRGSRFTTSVSM